MRGARADIFSRPPALRGRATMAVAAAARGRFVILTPTADTGPTGTAAPLDLAASRGNITVPCKRPS